MQRFKILHRTFYNSTFGIRLATCKFNWLRIVFDTNSSVLLAMQLVLFRRYQRYLTVIIKQYNF
ncbi:hypothetical protein DSCA_50450 [Desulfosarcina alkanivorans]|uniref:Uncharacterized protein n=1 Tax=Desulfosarcina alkanivorans TaxID=571177 RepID=A0A5K7YRY7_9BACT|nr:hypothetical protein DSCA_50450 [Desulfosarcina alkanivorans]